MTTAAHDSQRKPVCAVVGVGPGNGAALARRFAREGYAVALLARKLELSEALAGELGRDRAKAFACDVGDAASIKAAFAAIRAELGEVDVVLYNAGSGTWGTFDDVTAAQFESAWRVNTMGAFLVSHEVTEGMKKAGRGSIIFVSATSARRGMPMTAAFAPAKAAQRSLAESMAKHLGPKGIHVALIVIDGVVDLPATRERMKDKDDSFFVRPDDVADTAFWLTRQNRSAWSFEVEARPFAEKW